MDLLVCMYDGVIFVLQCLLYVLAVILFRRERHDDSRYRSILGQKVLLKRHPLPCVLRPLHERPELADMVWSCSLKNSATKSWRESAHCARVTVLRSNRYSSFSCLPGYYSYEDGVFI